MKYRNTDNEGKRCLPHTIDLAGHCIFCVVPPSATRISCRRDSWHCRACVIGSFSFFIAIHCAYYARPVTQSSKLFCNSNFILLQIKYKLVRRTIDINLLVITLDFKLLFLLDFLVLFVYMKLQLAVGMLVSLKSHIL